MLSRIVTCFENFQTVEISLSEVVEAILICGAILIICVSNLRNRRDQRGEENKLWPQL